MSAADQGQRGTTAQGSSAAFVWPCVGAIAGTMIGEALGSNLAEQLVAGVLTAFVGAVLTAPGTRTHHRRRIVAVALLVGVLEMLRGVKRALASSTRHNQRRPPRHSHEWRVSVNWATVCLAAVAGFGLGSLGTTATGSWTQASIKAVAVPDVTRDPALTALRKLRRAKLAPISVSEPSESIPKGRVKRTSPLAGAQVPVRSTVRLVVSSGVETVSVPDVTGKSERAAMRMLKRTKLAAVSVSSEPSESIPKGRVKRTSPLAGAQVPVRSTIRLVLSSGVETVSVPDARGKSERVALALLRQAKLAPIKVTEPSKSIPQGRVIRTAPLAGAQVRPHSPVKLFVSGGRSQPAPATAPQKGPGFRSPSGNIRCIMAAASLPDIEGRELRSIGTLWCLSYEPPRLVTLSAEGKAVVCNGQACIIGSPQDSARDSARVLGYGESDRFGLFRCSSSESGIRCVAIESGNGFTISQQGVDADQPVGRTTP